MHATSSPTISKARQNSLTCGVPTAVKVPAAHQFALVCAPTAGPLERAGHRGLEEASRRDRTCVLHCVLHWKHAQSTAPISPIYCDLLVSRCNGDRGLLVVGLVNVPRPWPRQRNAVPRQSAVPSMESSFLRPPLLPACGMQPVRQWRRAHLSANTSMSDCSSFTALFTALFGTQKLPDWMVGSCAPSAACGEAGRARQSWWRLQLWWRHFSFVPTTYSCISSPLDEFTRLLVLLPLKVSARDAGLQPACMVCVLATS